MKINKLYDKDVSRRINPAVVVSEMDDYSINQEIDEYVFTPGVSKNMHEFLDAIINKKVGKTGIWIDGYYGSGKSHFLKYIFYCLKEEHRTTAFINYKTSSRDNDFGEGVSPGDIKTLETSLSKIVVEEIMFNIDAVSDHEDDKERITRVFLNQLNKFRGFNDSNIALALYLEKPLSKDGNFEAFKEEIKKTFKEDWSGNELNFINMYLSQVIEIAQKFDTKIDVESLKSSILNKKQDYTIDFLIKELKDYLSGTDNNYRLIFLLDEVSQYIGDNRSLLLNLQTIIEELGANLGTKVWLACTAQQDLKSLVDNAGNKQGEFGKILGRFETQISLESQDAAQITKHRILEKDSDGIAVLNKFYTENKGDIENQFVFDHDLYENFENKSDFTLTYPFVPYQFRLISDVFESFSNVGYVGEGIKNTERAILGITHFTANLSKDNEVGYFVPFDQFFNEQMLRSLHHGARNILDRAYNIDDVEKNEFARRVVNTLFMISSLTESTSVNFPANIENLSLLLMDSLKTTKVEIQNKVKEVLDVLATKNIIRESEGKYRFFKEDEVEVASMISNTTITSEDRLSVIYSDVIEKIAQPRPQVAFGNRNFKMAISIDDKEIGTSGDFKLKFTIYESEDLDSLSHNVPTNDLIVGISDWLKQDPNLSSKINDYVRTHKYVRANIASASGTRSQTLNKFGEDNKILLNEIRLVFEQKFLETSIISKQQVVQPNELNGNSANSRLNDMVDRHIAEVYKKHELSNGYATINNDLLTNASSKQKDAFADLSPAEDEMEIKINQAGESPVLVDIIKTFDKSPYGWKDISTIDVLVALAKKGRRRFEWRNDEVDISTFANKAINSREREALTIHKEKVHSIEDVKEFIENVNDHIFNEVLIPSDTSDFKTAVETFKVKIGKKIEKLNKLKEEYSHDIFVLHINDFYKELADIYQSRSDDQVLTIITERKEKLSEIREVYLNAEEFIDQNIKSYKEIIQFVEKNKVNFEKLTSDQFEKGQKLIIYLTDETKPWDDFPQFKKVYKELSTAVSDKISELRASVLKNYKAIFKEIEAKKNDLKIGDISLTSDEKMYLDRLENENQISQLEIYALQEGDFKSQNFKKLEDFAAEQEAKKTGKTYQSSVNVSIVQELPPITISSPEQLDTYLAQLRVKLMIKLEKNKKIFLS